MKDKSGSKVPVQKGTIISNPPTSKQMPWPEKVRDREAEIRLKRSAQELSYHTPKR
jgi:hypothetical protein